MKTSLYTKRVVAVVILVVVVAALVLTVKTHPLQQNTAPPPLSDSTGGPIGLIGIITAVGTSTLTVEGQPPGNTSPILLHLSVGPHTTLTKLSAAYATSSITLNDLSVGARVNVAADAPDQSGVRSAERIIVIPSAH